MNYVLLGLFSTMTLLCASTIFFLTLNEFDKYFIHFIFYIQFVAIYSLLFEYTHMLFITHIIYGLSILIGSLFAKNEYIIFLILSVITVAKICVIQIGDCPYHSSSKRLRFVGGGENDDALYAVCLCIIIFRFYK